METLHNQELVATILEDNVASELTTIQDFLRWTYSTFNRSDIYYGQGHDNAWDESLQFFRILLNIGPEVIWVS